MVPGLGGRDGQAALVHLPVATGARVSETRGGRRDRDRPVAAVPQRLLVARKSHLL